MPAAEPPPVSERESHASLLLPDLHEAGRPGDETWIDVIRKMDEVYSDLLQYQVALEEKNGELEETQQFLHSVLDAMSDVLVVCDRYGRIVQVNRALTVLVGRPEAELHGSAVGVLFHDDRSREKATAFSRELQEGPLSDCEVALLASDGEAVPVAFNCSPRIDAQGRFMGMVMLGRPIGELRRAYSALHTAHEELKTAQRQLVHSEKMASLGRLVAGVAHELNNPISFVLGNVHALARYAGRLREYLEALHAGGGAAEWADLRKRLRIDFILSDLDSLLGGAVEGAERTRDIVDDLKRFSVMDREEPQPFDLVEVIARATHWVGKAARGRFEVELDLPGALPVVGTAAHLQQVFINLIQNAQDATRDTADPHLLIHGRRLAGQVVVSLTDNGPGIPPEALPHLFDPFFTTKEVGQGTGLGLSISYGIIERHGGRLLADNAPAGGARFTLELPAAEGA